jgi:HEAT repeat protein/beta-lactamase regulating signal transducer with metallopeptidase domain
MTIVESVGWVLVHFIWQGVAIALALAAVLALTSKTQARLRYVFSCAALVLMLAATVVTAAQLSIQSESTLAAPVTRALITSSSTDTGDRAPAGNHGVEMGAREMTSQGAGGWRDRLAQRLGPLVERSVRWLVLVWIVGVSVMSIRLAGGWWRTRALGVDGVSPVPAWADETLAMLCARLGIKRAVALVTSVRVSVPVVLGHVKPVVVVPAAAFAGLTPLQLEAILAHELAHIRRHDYLVNLAQSVIETLLFYHPAVWWVSHQVRVAREHCCDDLAVRVCGNRRGYIHALLDLEELRAPRAMLALGATDGSLLGRAQRLLRQSDPPSDAPRLAASAIVLSIVCTLAVLSFVSVERVDASLAAAIAAPTSVHEAVMPSETGVGQSAQSTPVALSPDLAATLGSRWAWAERAARNDRRARYWIGYSISPVRGLPPFVYFDRASRVLGNKITFSGHTLSNEVTGLRFPGRPLALSGGDTGLKVLFNLDADRGTPMLTAVHVSTLSLPVELRNQPIFWLGAAESSQSLELVDRLYARARTSELKDDLVAAAGVHDASPAVVAWLAARVDSGDPDDVRANAAEWIAWHPIRESIGILDRIARADRASKVRQEAAEALGDLVLPEAAPVLVALARELQDEQARREAVEALGARSEPIAQDALAQIVRQDSSTQIQREAVETLGDYKDQRGVPLLTELARTHPHVDVRREAIETLGDVMAPQSLVPLLKDLAAADPDARVQEEVVDTLAGIEDPAGLKTIRELAQSHASANVRREAVEALAHRASAHTNAREHAEIIELLSTIATTDAEINVRAEAVETLGEIDDPNALERLRELARTHPDDRVRAEAVETLGDVKSPSTSVSLLKSIALGDHSTDVQREAIETLGDLADGAGISTLVELAREHSAEGMRKLALEALLESDHPKARELFDRALGRAPKR